MTENITAREAAQAIYMVIDDSEFRTAGSDDGEIIKGSLSFCVNSPETGEVGYLYSGYVDGEIMVGSYTESADELKDEGLKFFSGNAELAE